MIGNVLSNNYMSSRQIFSFPLMSVFTRARRRIKMGSWVYMIIREQQFAAGEGIFK